MRNKKTSRMLLAFVLVMTMVVSTFQLDGIVSYAAATDKVVVYVAAEGTNVSGAAVTVSPTAIVLKTGSTAADAIEQVLDQSAYKGDYQISNTAWGKSLDAIHGLNTYNEGDNWYYWSFYVNGNYSELGIGSYKLQDQDQISLIYSYNNTNMVASSYGTDDVTKNPTNEQKTALLNTAITNKNTLANVIFEKTFESGAKVPVLGASTNDYYTVYSLANAGLEIPEFYSEVYSQLEKDLKTLEQGKALKDGTTKKSILESGYATPYYAKLALAVTAMGYDATNVGGVNLMEQLTSREVFEKSSKAADYGKYGREGMLLMAIDEGSYTIPEGKEYVTRAEVVSAEAIDVVNAIEIAMNWDSMDTAAMAIQSLAPYVNKSVTVENQEEVVACVKQAIHYMEHTQNMEGSVGNVWTLAQVMYALGKLDINILDETNGTDFIKNGVTLFDQAAAYVDAEKKIVDEALMGYQPEQLLRGYSATIGAAVKAGVAYTTPLTSSAVVVKKPVEESTNKSISIKNAKISKLAKKIYTGKALKPSVTVTIGKTKLKKDKDYKVTYSQNKNLGTAKVVVTGIGNYTGTCQTTFAIVLGTSKITKVTKTGKITFQKVTGAKEYKVQISTDKNFKKDVTNKTTNKTSINYTMKKGKKYFIRVCAIHGKNKGAFGAIKSIKK